MSENINIPENISIIIVEFLEGNISEENLSQLTQWLKTDSEHLKQFNALKTVWLMNGKPLLYKAEKIDNDLSKVKEKIRWKKLGTRRVLTFRKVAASWVVFLVAGGLLGMMISGERKKVSSAAVTTITAPLGAKSVVDLPDGSKVWVNAGSKISYSSNFGKDNRNIKLVGEAYFNVSKNPALPFIVKTSDITVKALGTRFNVKAYPEEKTITTTLEEGKILVTSIRKKFPEKVIELKPREMITFFKKVKEEDSNQKKTTEKSDQNTTREGILSEVIPEVKTELQTSWKDNTWIIEGKPLGELAPMLERKYNVVINFEMSEIRRFKFTGKIQNETIEQIMEAVKLSSPIKFNIDNNVISLYLNNSLYEKYTKNTNK